MFSKTILLWVPMGILALLPTVSAGSETTEATVTVPLHKSRSLTVPGLSRVAVGNGKIVAARAVPPETLLLTGKKSGSTTVRAWGSGGERVYEVRVLSGEVSSEDPVVSVELEFLEMNETDESRTGLRFPDTVEASASGSLQGTLSGSGLHYVTSFQAARAWLEALVTRGEARVLARPRLFVRLGEQVAFTAGGEFPVQDSVESQGVRFRRVEWKPYGLSVKLRPDSGDMNYLASDIDVEISEPAFSESVGGIPSLHRRHLSTRMVSRAGETVILSGLVRRLQSRRREGLPVLGSVPVLGILFSREQTDARDSELLMAMTLGFRTRARQRELETRFREKWGRHDE